MTEKVIIFDTTLRDGEQSPGASMNVAEKMRLATQLEKLGVDVIEAGFPAASDGDFDAVSQIAGKLKAPEVAGLARADREDIDRAWQAVRHAVKPRIHTFIATSEAYILLIADILVNSFSLASTILAAWYTSSVAASV